MIEQLKSARGDRSQHYRNLSNYERLGVPAENSIGNYWQIDESIYWEFLEMLPPVYCPGGFRICENLTGSIAPTFLKIAGDYWCAYTDRDITSPAKMIKIISRERARA